MLYEVARMLTELFVKSRKKQNVGKLFSTYQTAKSNSFYTLYSINCVLRDQEWKGNGLGPEYQFSKNYFEESISYLNIMKSEDFWKLLISKEFQGETGPGLLGFLLFEECVL